MISGKGGLFRATGENIRFLLVLGYLELDLAASARWLPVLSSLWTRGLRILVSSVCGRAPLSLH